MRLFLSLSLDTLVRFDSSVSSIDSSLALRPHNAVEVLSSCDENPCDGRLRVADKALVAVPLSLILLIPVIPVVPKPLLSCRSYLR